MFMALATSLVVLFLLLCYCRHFDKTFSLLWLYLGNSQVSIYRTIGPTLVNRSARTNNVDYDQTAPKGAFRSGSALLAILSYYRVLTATF